MYVREKVNDEAKGRKTQVHPFSSKKRTKWFNVECVVVVAQNTHTHTNILNPTLQYQVRV